MLREKSPKLAFWKTTGYGIGLYYSFHRQKKKKEVVYKTKAAYNLVW